MHVEPPTKRSLKRQFEGLVEESNLVRSAESRARAWRLDEDFVQDFLIALYRQWKKDPGRIVHFKSWAMTVLRHTAFAVGKQRARREVHRSLEEQNVLLEAHSAALAEAVAAPPLCELLEVEVSFTLEQLLVLLTPKEKEAVLELKRRMEVEATGEKLPKWDAALHRALCRARRRLQQYAQRIQQEADDDAGAKNPSQIA
jgi:RNA polymerase sigma factor (sigma-70 family)